MWSCFFNHLHPPPTASTTCDVATQTDKPAIICPIAKVKITNRRASAPLHAHATLSNHTSVVQRAHSLYALSQVKLQNASRASNESHASHASNSSSFVSTNSSFYGPRTMVLLRSMGDKFWIFENLKIVNLICLYFILG